MDHQTIRQQMPTLVAGHVPSNARSFQFNIFDGTPKENMLGFRVDPSPFEGKVVATTEDAIVIKIGRTKFAVLDRALITEVPEEGAKVEVIPYARRRFDGQRADKPEEVIEHTADGTPYTVQRMILGAAPAMLPIAQPQCLELQQLIEQLEQMPAPDGHRRIAHMLVDAQARDFTIVDPTPADIIRTPPTISFTVQTAKLSGRVSVIYMRADDTYSVELHRNDERIERRDDIYFDMLGETLADLFDDGTWCHIRVHTLQKPARSKKAVSSFN
ncbi:GTPase [Allopusillimonas ginsengisoli]|uniref:GTPase n=1 Tax=Allopusillimonas ginsengisoli TaxID=453575 RepID=UPI0039C02E0C